MSAEFQRVCSYGDSGPYGVWVATEDDTPLKGTFLVPKDVWTAYCAARGVVRALEDAFVVLENAEGEG